jgi:hypothetical protein
MIDNPIENAVEYYNKLNPTAPATLADSKSLLLRLTLNHIRHNYSNYEQLIKQVGSKLYNKIELKKNVNQAIIQKYQLDNFIIA